MTRTQLRILWLLAALLLVSAGVRAALRPDPYRTGAALGAIEDRREHRFRDLSWSSAQRLYDNLLVAAEQAPDPVARARILARLASLQRERGFDAGARAAATEALRLGGNDPETRRLLGAPLDLAPR